MTRPALSPKHTDRIRAAQRAQQNAQAQLQAAVLAALADGASWSAITEATGVAATTISRYVKSAQRDA